MIKSKIVNKNFLPKRAKEVRSVSKTVVLCYGTFDIYHPGHADLFERAKEIGDMLVVTIEESPNMLSNVYSDKERMYIIASHECVDYVTMGNTKEIVELIKPEYVVTTYIGANPPHRSMPEIANVTQINGGKFVTLPRIMPTTSNGIVKNILTIEQDNYGGTL